MLDEPVLDGSVTSALRELGTATVHEAAPDSRVLPAAIHNISPGLFLAGRALPVAGPGGDNLWIHRAVNLAQPGDVLVVDVSGHHEGGYWGEILSWAAKARGIAGVVIDGCVRDSERLAAVGVPIFARGICMRGTTKPPDGNGHVGEVVRIGNAEVLPGDVVIGDADGVLAIAAARFDAALEAARARQAREADIIAAIGRGASTMVLYDLPSGVV